MDKGYTSDVVREQTRDKDLADVMEELEEKEVQAVEGEMAARKLKQSKASNKPEKAKEEENTEMDTTEESSKQKADSAVQPSKSPSSDPKQPADKDGQQIKQEAEKGKTTDANEKAEKRQQKRQLKTWSPADSETHQTSTLKARELHRQGLSAEQAAAKGERAEAVRMMQSNRRCVTLLDDWYRIAEEKNWSRSGHAVSARIRHLGRPGCSPIQSENPLAW